MAPDEGRSKSRVRRVLAVSLLAQVLLVAAGELWLRAQVPGCGVTPFRLSRTPGLSSELRPGFSTLYKGIEVSINARGYRGPEPAPRDDGSDERLRVVLVGDSYTFGSAVELADTIGVRLADELQRLGVAADVVNLGVPGYTASEVAVVVEQRALDFAPDVVVYVFFANDTDPPREYESIPPDKVIDPMYGFLGGSALLEWTSVRARQLAAALGRPLGRRTPEFSRRMYEGAGGERVRSSLERMRDACADAGVRFLVASYPYLTFTDVNPFRPVDELAARDARAMGIDFLDLVDAFEGERDLTVYWAHVFDHHPSGDANARVARFLAPRLVE